VASESLLLAETTARELGWLPLDDALELVILYARLEPRKLERAGRRWLSRALTERALAAAEVQLLTAAVGALASELGEISAATLRAAEKSSRTRTVR